MRIVLDPSVVAAAAISRSGPGWRLLLQFRAGAFEVVVSPAIIDELRSLLLRPRIRRHLRAEDVDAIVELLLREGVMLEDPAAPDEPLTEDPGDDRLLALAREGSANAVVANDPHLIALGDRLPILAPSQFLLYLQK